MLTAVVLAAGVWVPHEGMSGARLTAQEVLRRPYAHRYWVQIRQPQWQEQTFTSRENMDYFIRDQQRNGWELQVGTLPGGEYSVRYRLMRWGGSRVVDSRAEARDWAAQLEEQGYETRIVDYP